MGGGDERSFDSWKALLLNERPRTRRSHERRLPASWTYTFLICVKRVVRLINNELKHAAQIAHIDSSNTPAILLFLVCFRSQWDLLELHPCLKDLLAAAVQGDADALA